jgi:hypothetical protein
MNFKSIVFAAVTCCLASTALAGDQYFSYKDWHVQIKTVDTGEDLRITCTMWTGGDGDPIVGLSISNGDALPPDVYPGVQLTESAVRGYATVLQNDQTVNFVFDDGDSAQASVYAGIDDEGIAFADTNFAFEDNHRVLQAMQRNGLIDIVGPGGLVYSASLNGFSASYRKVAEQCGFTVAGVIN